MKRIHWIGPVLALSVALVACPGGTPPEDGLTPTQRQTLAAAPALAKAKIPAYAQTVDAATLADAVADETFRFLTPAQLEESAADEAGLGARQARVLEELRQGDPALLAALGDLSGDPGDTISIPMPGDGASGTVRVNAPITEAAGYAVALKALGNVAVQRSSYTADFQALSESAARGGADLTPYNLTDPGRLLNADLPTVQAARGALETAMERVAPKLQSPVRQVSATRAAGRITTQGLNDPGNEDGATNIFGIGYFDRAGVKNRCEGWSKTGLYGYVGFLPSAARWTSVKNQGRRGTCWAFAITAYMEDLKSQEGGGKKLWNFSEQATNAFMKYDVRGDKSYLGSVASDTEDTIAAFQALFDRKYQPVLETAWYYNAAAQWPAPAAGEKQTYKGVCKGYTATSVNAKQPWCSDSSHEYPVICTTTQNSKVCAYLNVAGNTKIYPALPIPWRSKVDAWYRPQTTSSNADANTTRILSYAMASWNEPVVISVDADYLIPDASGFVANTAPFFINGKKDVPASNHALLLVDYLTEEEVKAALPSTLWANGGYLVLRNSYGDCWGDSGFAYVPLSWAKRYSFKYARVVN